MDLEKFKIVMPAMVTSFDKNGELDEEILRKLLRYHLDCGVKGFYMNGGTSEFPMLRADERKRALEIAVEEVKGKAIIINHIGCNNQSEAEELARHSKKAGADAVSAVPPYYYKYNFDDVVKYYTEITADADLPMIVYNVPSCTGLAMTVENVGELRKIPNVIGIKNTTSDFFMLQQLKATYPDFIVYNGPDEMALCGLSMGADGAIGTTYNCLWKFANGIKVALEKGDIDEARKNQAVIDEFIAKTRKCNVLASCKYLMKKNVADAGLCRKPLHQLTDEEKKYLDTLTYLLP